MSDLSQGQSMSAAQRFISGGAANTFIFDFQPDKVVLQNLTQWAGTAANLPVSLWFRLQSTAAEAYQQQVIDSAAAQSFNFLLLGSNGFTSANTSGGMDDDRSLISGVTAADPVVITTSAVHGLQNNQIIRVTDLGSDMPTARGMEQLDKNRYKITVLSTTTFSLQDPVSGEDIDGSAYTAWVSGGRINLESKVLALNNPQQGDYATTPYVPNPSFYKPVEYKLTGGSGVIGDDGDVMLLEAYKWGSFKDLGDIG